MWANAQRDGRPAEYRWRPLFNTAKLTPTTRVPCSNAAKTRNPLKFAGVPQSIPAVSGPKFAILCGSMADIQSAAAEIGEEKKKEERRKKEETTGQKYNGLPYSIGRP